MPVALLGRVAIVLVVVGEVALGNERRGIASAADGDGDGVTLHWRIGCSAAEGRGVAELRHAPIRNGVSSLNFSFSFHFFSLSLSLN